jgi:hypothetical protein
MAKLNGRRRVIPDFVDEAEANAIAVGIRRNGGRSTPIRLRGEHLRHRRRMNEETRCAERLLLTIAWTVNRSFVRDPFLEYMPCWIKPLSPDGDGSSEAGMWGALLPIVTIGSSCPPQRQCGTLLLFDCGIGIQLPQPLSTPRSLRFRDSICRWHCKLTQFFVCKPYATRVALMRRGAPCHPCFGPVSSRSCNGRVRRP